jgi:hypothetical protein
MAPDRELYPRLLGNAWNELDGCVRRLHLGPYPVRAAGTFRVWHDSGPWVRVLRRLLRLPHAGESVPLRLTVLARGHGEEWRRVFAGRPLTSFQSAAPGRLLVERMGPIEMRLRLRAAEGSLSYRSVAVACVGGPLRLALPRGLAPRVTAREDPGGGPERVRIFVQVFVPRLGLLIAYAGTVATGESG